MSVPVPPPRFQALVGRKFRDIGPNGLNRKYRIDRLEWRPNHQHGPWVAVCFAYGWSPPFTGPRFRKIDRFFDPQEYEEVA